MVKKVYETQRLLLVASHPKFAKAAAEFGRRNAEFFQKSESRHEAGHYALGEVRRALSADRHNAAAGAGFRYWLVPKGTNEIVGTVALNNILWKPFWSCFLGYKMDENHTGEGYATEAVRRILRMAFEDVGLHRVEIYVMPRNTASLRVAEKLGFEQEGISRKCLEVNGVWEDHVRLAKLAPKI